MENPARTAAYRALMAERRQEIRTQLSRILSPGADFVWEVGCGHGHFLTAYAEAHPGQFCVGIDIIGERIERANRKRDRARLANLHFFHVEAGVFLPEIPASNCLAEVFVLFPDPWPKLRHHKHRLVQPGFLDALAVRARPGCRLHFRTDYQPYFESVTFDLQSHPRWVIVPAPWPFEFNTVFQQRAPVYHSLSAERRP